VKHSVGYSCSVVNFINILSAPFSYKILAPKITKLKPLLCNFLVPKYWHKSCSKNVDEIDYRMLRNGHGPDSEVIKTADPIALCELFFMG